MTGLLLINLGTPESPRAADVGRYLREFLMDPLVVDLPWPLRFFLVNALIVPRRAIASGKLYEKVWTAEGSPLLKFGRDLARAVREKLPGVPVELGMRYGNPSLADAVGRLKAAGAARLVAFPLYPQYSLAATASSVAASRGAGFSGEMKFVPAFYDHDGFLAAFTERIAASLSEAPWDKVLFSYHGLPERQVKRTAPSACLFNEGCCAAIVESNRDCYRAQCYETSRQLACRLGLKPEQHVTAFQSRLGRTPWIRPWSDELYVELPKQGVRRLVVASPSFVADCLETLEEIAMRGKESFVLSGGESLRLVPSLNASPSWVDTVVDLFRRHG